MPSRFYLDVGNPTDNAAYPIQNVQRALNWIRTSPGVRNAIFAACVTDYLKEGHPIYEGLGKVYATELLRNRQIDLDGTTLTLVTERDQQPYVGAVSSLVAVFPCKRFLEKLDSFTGVSDMLLVPKSMKEAKSWAEMWGAHILYGEF